MFQESNGTGTSTRGIELWSGTLYVQSNGSRQILAEIPYSTEYSTE